MADEKIFLLKHAKLLAMRCSAMITGKISELATTVSEALVEMDEVKADTTFVNEEVAKCAKTTEMTAITETEVAQMLSNQT